MSGRKKKVLWGKEPFAFDTLYSFRGEEGTSIANPASMNKALSNKQKSGFRFSKCSQSRNNFVYRFEKYNFYKRDNATFLLQHPQNDKTKE